MYLHYLRIIDKKSEQVEEKLHMSTRNQELMELLELEKSPGFYFYYISSVERGSTGEASEGREH